jgi:hypothetical protein
MKYIGNFNAYVNKDNGEFTLKESGGWISVKDRLPIDKNKIKTYELREVIVFRNGYVSFEVFQAGPSPKPWGYFNDDSGEITHWQPLPEPPKDKQ